MSRAEFGGSDDDSKDETYDSTGAQCTSTHCSTKTVKGRVASQFFSPGGQKCDPAPQNDLSPSSTTLTNRIITKYNDKELKEMIDCL